MARFLVVAQPHTSPDPETAKGCYRRGDIVCAMPDGHEWGEGERWPKFLWLDIPGITVEQAETYLEDYADDHPDLPVGGVRLLKVMRRLWIVEVDRADLPQWVKEQIKDGHLTVTWTQIKNFVRNHRTGGTA